MPFQTVCVHPPLNVAHVLQRVPQVEHPARTEHDVEVDLLAQAFP